MKKGPAPVVVANVAYWRIREVGERLVEVRLAKHSGRDFLTLSSSHSDPEQKSLARLASLPAMGV